MENENEVKKEIKKENNLPPITSIIIVLALIVGAFIYTTQFKSGDALSGSAQPNTQQQNELALQDWVELPIVWGDMGVKMIDAGVIDKDKFENLYSQRGGLAVSDEKFLTDANNGNLMIHSENSGMVLNMLWAFGLANDNPILKNGPMMDPKYGGAGNFASTGGWTLAKGPAMDHYSVHNFVTLTPEQQALVERVAKNIYRPCCDNSTYFPDCNHGIAMLGLLELMASQGVNEANMYKFALQVNTLWFPSQYQAIKTFVTSQGIDWNTVDPKKILGAEYSSASGYQKVLSQIKPQEQKGGASCGA
jgi:hypothetical protein